MGVGEERDAPAGRALAAEVIFQSLTIGGLSKHAGQGELAEAARAGEKDGMGDAVAAQSAAKGGDDALVAKEFIEAHRSASPLFGGFWQDRQNSGENVFGDIFWWPH